MAHLPVAYISDPVYVDNSISSLHLFWAAQRFVQALPEVHTAPVYALQEKVQPSGQPA